MRDWAYPRIAMAFTAAISFGFEAHAWQADEAASCPAPPSLGQGTESSELVQLRQLRTAAETARSAYQTAEQNARQLLQRLTEVRAIETGLLEPQIRFERTRAEQAHQALVRQRQAMTIMVRQGVSQSDMLLILLDDDEPTLGSLAGFLGLPADASDLGSLAPETRTRAEAILGAAATYRSAANHLEFLDQQIGPGETPDALFQIQEAQENRAAAEQAYENGVDQSESAWSDYSTALSRLRDARFELDARATNVFPPELVSVAFSDTDADTLSLRWEGSEQIDAADRAIVRFLRRGLAIAIERESAAVDLHYANAQQTLAEHQRASQALVRQINSAAVGRTYYNLLDFGVTTGRDVAAGVPLGVSVAISALLRYQDLRELGSIAWTSVAGGSPQLRRRGPDIQGVLAYSDRLFADARQNALSNSEQAAFIDSVTADSLYPYLQEMRRWFGPRYGRGGMPEGTEEEIYNHLISNYAQDRCALVFADTRRNDDRLHAGIASGPLGRYCYRGADPLAALGTELTPEEAADDAHAAFRHISNPLTYRMATRSFMGVLVKPHAAQHVARDLARRGSARLSTSFDDFLRNNVVPTARIPAGQSPAAASRGNMFRGLVITAVQAVLLSEVEARIDFATLEASVRVVSADIERINALNHLRLHGHLRRYYQKLDRALAEHEAFGPGPSLDQALTRVMVQERGFNRDGLDGDLLAVLRFSEPVQLDCVSLGHAVQNFDSSQNDLSESWRINFNANEALGDRDSGDATFYVIAHADPDDRVIDGDPETIPVLSTNPVAIQNWEQTPFRTDIPLNYELEDAIAIVLDNSGSMADAQRFEPARAAVSRLIGEIDEDSDDIVSITRFRDRCGVHSSDFTRDGQTLEAFLEETSPDYSTPLASAITEATNNLTSIAGANRHVLYVLTDGEEECDGNPALAMHRARRLLGLAQCADGQDCGGSR